MYNSQNLPLSYLFVIKKIIVRSSLPIVPFIVVFPFFYFLPKIGHGPNEVEGVNLQLLFYYLAPFLFIFLWSIIQDYLLFKLFYYNCADNTIKIKRGIISREIVNLEYNKIQGVYLEQDFLDRLLGIETVRFETAGPSSRLNSRIEGLKKKNAETIRDFLLGKSKNIK